MSIKSLIIDYSELSNKAHNIIGHDTVLCFVTMKGISVYQLARGWAPHPLSSCILAIIGFIITPAMVNKKSFKSGNGIINPRKEKGEPLLGSDAIMVAISSDLQYIVDVSHAERATSRKTTPFNLFLIKRDEGPPCGLAGPLLGAPQGVIVMEKLIALGAQRIWFLGWCGSLQPSVAIGDIIIPTTALSEEGTSAHYPVNTKKKQANPFLIRRLEDALQKAHLSYRKGPVWTTDALYRETSEKVVEYGKRGYLAVEMEMSALITVAVYRSIKLAGLLIVSDELFSLQWNHGFGTDKLKKVTRDAGRVMLSLCMDENSESDPLHTI